ncbi:MAG: hypothetical protein QW275_02555 [Candidatus Anstonellaceae archaeon]
MRRLEDELDITIYGIAFALAIIILLSAINALIYIPAIASWIQDETGSSQSHVFWTSQAVPFRIHMANKTPFISPCKGGSNGYILEAENAWIGSYSIIGISLDGKEGKVCDASIGRMSPIIIPNGQRKLVGVEFEKPISCTPEEKEWALIEIKYRKEDPFVPMGVPREGVQTSSRKLPVTCIGEHEELFGFHFESSYILPQLVPGEEYEAQLEAKGGVEPYTYSTADYLYGLKIDSSGRIYGKSLPSEDLPDQIVVVILAEDAEGNTVQRAFLIPVRR